MSRMRKRRRREAGARGLPVVLTDQTLKSSPSPRLQLERAKTSGPTTAKLCRCGNPVAGCPVDDDCPASRLCLPHYLEDAEERGVLLHG